MRKLLISLAVAGAALAVASPASAQYYGGQPYGYGYAQPHGHSYGQPYGYAQSYGYNNYGYSNYDYRNSDRERREWRRHHHHRRDRDDRFDRGRFGNHDGYYGRDRDRDDGHD